jgi:phosphate starvation-inducible PhoH-like protein
VDILALIDGSSARTKNTTGTEIISPVIMNGKRDTVRAKTEGQLKLYRAIKRNDVVFAIGPAGTGKTFIAVASALEALQSGSIDRIILTRPAIEAGESLGFLPGDLREKVNPYLRPIYDALYEILPAEKIQYYMKTGAIEIAPIAFMRGRTLNNAFAILDEAQNTTLGQMKMFLTRLGVNSKALITGDITQIDLKKEVPSGLVEIRKFLDNIPGLQFCYLEPKDIIRHELVKRIISAYEHYENMGKAPEEIASRTKRIKKTP